MRHKRVIKDLQPHQIYNHVAGISEIGCKSNLYLNLEKYYTDSNKPVNEFLPETFVIKLEQNFHKNENYQKF